MTEKNINMPFLVKLKLIGCLPLLVLRALKYIVTILISSRPSRPFKRTLTASFSRASALTIAPLTSAYPNALPTTGEAIHKYCETKGLAYHSITIPVPSNPAATSIPSATLHFLTLSANTATKNRVLLFLHGGGYTSPLFGPSHIPFAIRLATAVRAPTLAILEYGLAPAVPYPGQLVQSVEVLRYLLRPSDDGGAGYAAQDVILVGDSAGGNLVAGVLAHIACASPYVAPLSIRSRLGAAVMVSPWVGMKFVGGSYERNAGVDVIGVKWMEEARRKWKPVQGEVWADMVGGKVPTESGEGRFDAFWKGVFQGESRIVERALVTVGDEEIFLDSVLLFGRMAGAVVSVAGCVKDTAVKGGKDDAEMLLVKSSGEAHVGALVDFLVGVEVKHSMLAELLKFLESF